MAVGDGLEAELPRQGGPADGGFATEPFNYARWNVNQPDNAGNEDWGSTNGPWGSRGF